MPSLPDLTGGEPKMTTDFKLTVRGLAGKLARPTVERGPGQSIRPTAVGTEKWLSAIGRRMGRASKGGTDGSNHGSGETGSVDYLRDQ